jgi:hypothetical protein
VKVSWDQAHAWRLRRQLVEPRASAASAAPREIIERLCGVQAQVASSAELAVLLRQDAPAIGAVRQELEAGRLVKTWAMRGTLHLLPAASAAAFLSVIASARSWTKGSWQKVFGPTPDEVDALVEAVGEALDGEVLTREELVGKLLARPEFGRLSEELRSGWGALLKPLAWQGALCHGPVRGNQVTFARPGQLLAGWPGRMPSPDVAGPAVITAYLGAYGPATPAAFDAWLLRGGLPKKRLRGWFADLGDRLTEADVEGEAAYVLSEHADELARTKPSKAVRLLGAFDQYVLGPGTGDPRLLAPEHRSKVSKAAGWISPLVVVGGRILGVWELADDEVVVSMFPGSAKPPKKQLEAEVAHVAEALGRPRLGLKAT